jgi:hypothetical protein
MENRIGEQGGQADRCTEGQADRWIGERKRIGEQCRDSGLLDDASQMSSSLFT